MFADICCCCADGKDRRHGPTTNSRQMAGASDSPVIAGLARCARGLTSVPRHTRADMRIAAAESVLAKISSTVCDHLKSAPPHQASAFDEDDDMIDC